MSNRIQTRNSNGKWVDISINQLKELDTFRMLDEKGDEVVNARGKKYFICSSKPYEKFGDIVIDIY